MDDADSGVLIGDANQQRRDLLKEIIESAFRATCVCVDNFQSVRESVKQKDWPKDWAIVFVADDLPLASITKSPILPGQQVSELPGVTLCRLTAGLETPEAEGIIETFKLFIPPSSILTTEERQQIINEIAGMNRKLARRLFLPKIVPWKEDDRVLRAQIRAFGDGKKTGEEVLGELIAGCLDCREVTIERLKQGKSGAAIFRVRHLEVTEESGTQEKEFVLKLCNASNNENIEREVEGYQGVQDCFPNKEYDPHIPKLRPPLKQKDPHHPIEKYIFRENGWAAIRYDFLGGGKFGKFIDLEKTLILPARDLLYITEKTPIKDEVLSKIKNLPTEPALLGLAMARATRLYILDRILTWLKPNLYHRAWETRGKLWEFDEDKHEKYAARPPYSLSRRTKEEIASFLDSNEANKLGERFFEPHWDGVLHQVWEFIERSTIPKKLDRESLIVRSPVHGDLNANNILFWLDTPRPFLIDFPFFQKDGHALQDLAQLEVEIEFALMDRQIDSDPHHLKAYDYTYSQMSLWQEVENCLLSEKSWHHKKDSWSQLFYLDNVELCLEMVQEVRKCAWAVKENFVPNLQPKDFFDGYFAALLYHTLRAIGYDSLSVFKRLLAVYSAGKIIERMKM